MVRHADELRRWAEEGRSGATPVPAATVILVRDGRAGLETLMLRRNSKIAFGGMWAFPGGRVDSADRDEAAPDDELATARNTAIRETLEETNLVLAVDSLQTFSHWTPPPISPRRFLTWFFLAPAPGQEIAIDGGEIREHDWMAPADALGRRDAGEIELAPPTWVSLFELARCSDVAAALEMARARTPERFQTHIALEDGGPTALWHGDAGWDATDASVPGGRHRLRMHGDRWRYERSS